ncbi:hypothetical protein GmHk_19G054708 [Glycine max]|nr:hypothetical protein GmHk_19G054708 [Glycine max]
MLYLGCDSIPEAVENEDDLDDVHVVGHEEDVGGGGREVGAEAKQLVEGNGRKQYAKVFDYAHELLRSNPGSTVNINTVPSPEGTYSSFTGIVPGAPHRFCVLHLWQNFTKQWKSKELKGIVWQCAKSTTIVEFEGHMAHLKTINC